ncbi:CBS domain-containing protein [Peristeroidobacter soli]|jgi:CBS domain-containing protein|uniref:CBS domain-containing protein n=1 Tax=Peristeroidobacter soli TaxID=2497877 RepID=UPI00101E140B|nr:CBS domain-containing protein [Peristeroidobacter soli]
MKIADVCRHGAISIANTEGITDAARLMREHHVGFLIVHRLGDDLRRPIGVLTDRDMVVEVLAKKIDPEALRVDDVMTRDPLVAREDEDVSDLLQAMRLNGVRRVPVVDSRGALTGVIAIDDAFDLITTFMCDITGSIKHEQRLERRTRAG